MAFFKKDRRPKLDQQDQRKRPEPSLNVDDALSPPGNVENASLLHQLSAFPSPPYSKGFSTAPLAASSSSSYPQQQVPERSAGYNIGRQIINTRTTTDEELLQIQKSRRASLNSSQGSTHSTSSRTTIHLRTTATLRPTSATITVDVTAAASSGDPACLNGTDEIYSGLPAFKFGNVDASDNYQEEVSGQYDADHLSLTPTGDADVESQVTFDSQGSPYQDATSASLRSFSSRASSPQFSDYDDDDEYHLPVTFAQTPPRFDENEVRDRGYRAMNSAASGSEILRRMQTLPMASPTPETHGRQKKRETPLATLRRPSRSLDADLRQIDHAGQTDWHSLQGRSLAPERKKDSDSMSYDMDYIMSGVGASRRASIVPSCVDADALVASQERPSTASRFGWLSGIRRLSTVAQRNVIDDSFAKHVTESDQVYSKRRTGWTFTREKADGPGVGVALKNGGAMAVPPRPSESGKDVRSAPPGKMVLASQELWRCDHVGRFKVDRVQGLANPAQQRLFINHIIDPYSKGNTRGGPRVIMHKHTRTLAFSILRTYPTHHEIPSEKVASQSRSVHKMEVMLAPRKVQEQFTSTQTTNKLRSHGLLGGEELTRGEKRRREKERQRERRRLRQDTDGRTCAHGASSASSMASSVDGVTMVGTHRSLSTAYHDSSPTEYSPPPLSAPAERTEPPMSPTPLAMQNRHVDIQFDTSMPSEPSTSNSIVHSNANYAASSLSLDSRRSLLRRESHSDFLDDDDADDSDDYDRSLNPRTPHSEAYASLDANSIADIRGSYGSLHPRSSFSGAPSAKGLLSAAKRGKGSSNHYVVPSAAPPVPWMLTAPRELQENSERQMQGVNRSFQTLGLLPTYDKRKTARGKGNGSRRKKHRVVDAFEQVPDDALYMLLPMWVGETDSVSSTGKSYNVPLSDRQYLLVYYVPFSKKKKDAPDGGKKNKSPRPSSSTSAHSADENAARSSGFRVCARLVGYYDLCESGVRLSDEGMCITGSVDKAMETLPPAEIRLGHHHEVVIGICPSREEGIELILEGLEKLGLCLPPNDAYRPSDGEDEAELRLSPIGLAAVEMAWSGCMALSIFSGM